MSCGSSSDICSVVHGVVKYDSCVGIKGYTCPDMERTAVRDGRVGHWCRLCVSLLSWVVRLVLLCDNSGRGICIL